MFSLKWPLHVETLTWRDMNDYFGLIFTQASTYVFICNMFDLFRKIVNIYNSYFSRKQRFCRELTSMVGLNAILSQPLSPASYLPELLSIDI